MVWAIQATVSPTTATRWASSSSRVREATSSLQMFGVAADLFAQGVLFGGTFQRVLQQVVVDGLGDEVRRAEAQWHSTALSMSPCPVIATTCVSGF